MNINDNKNYYDTLEISVDATLQEIHNAYIRSKNAYTGDTAALYSLMSQNECDQIVEQIEEAYSVLGIAEKRRDYDRARGLNQTHTPEGFIENIQQKPTYKPSNSLDENRDLSKTISNVSESYNREEEFKYKSEHQAATIQSVSKVQAFKKFSLNYQEDSSFEQEIENCSEFTGDFLRKIREYKDVTIERMAEMTKISKTYIKKIENDEFSHLPAEVFTRGFVYQYAKCLKLNPDIVATSYLAHFRKNKTS